MVHGILPGPPLGLPVVLRETAGGEELGDEEDVMESPGCLRGSERVEGLRPPVGRQRGVEKIDGLECRRAGVDVGVEGGCPFAPPLDNKGRSNADRPRASVGW